MVINSWLAPTKEYKMRKNTILIPHGMHKKSTTRHYFPIWLFVFLKHTKCMYYLHSILHHISPKYCNVVSYFMSQLACLLVFYYWNNYFMWLLINITLSKCKYMIIIFIDHQIFNWLLNFKFFYILLILYLWIFFIFLILSTVIG